MVEQLALNCKEYMKPRKFILTPIKFNQGSEVYVGSGISSFFDIDAQ